MHNITFNDESHGCLIEQETLGEFIDLFFGGRDSKFIINQFDSTSPPNDSLRGLCRRFKGEYTIELWIENIQRHMRLGVRLGGNNTLARNVKHGVYLVLAHELRHAYQTMFHDYKHCYSFNAGKYMAKASEVDARAFVDTNYEAICAFINVEPMVPGSAESMIDMMIGEITDHISTGIVDDVADYEVWELAMTLPGDEQENFGMLSRGLISKGVTIT